MMKNFLLVFIGLSVISGIVLIAYFMHRETSSRYEREGVQITGTLFKKEIDVRKKSPKSAIETDYNLWVKYNHEGEESVLLVNEYISKKMFDEMQIGAELKLLHLPDDMIVMDDGLVYFQSEVLLVEALPVLKNRLRLYPVISAVLFLLGLIPFLFAFRRKLIIARG